MRKVWVSVVESDRAFIAEAGAGTKKARQQNTDLQKCRAVDQDPAFFVNAGPDPGAFSVLIRIQHYRRCRNYFVKSLL